MEGLDADLLRHALSVARRHGYAEVEIALEGAEFSAKLELSRGRRPAASCAPAEKDGAAEPQLVPIAAPLVGYYRPAKTPLTAGHEVTEGQVVAVIAALGIANDVESKVSGEVVEVLVEPNQPVEYGQTLAWVRP